jgi:hypothetical protein
MCHPASVVVLNAGLSASLEITHLWRVRQQVKQILSEDDKQEKQLQTQVPFGNDKQERQKGAGARAEPVRLLQQGEGFGGQGFYSGF